MNPHQIIVDYATAKGYDSWRVGIDATRAVRQIPAITELERLRELVKEAPKFFSVCDFDGEKLKWLKRAGLA